MPERRESDEVIATDSRAPPVRGVAGPATSMVGRSLGDFVVKEKIGEGGFGAVYRAEQPLLNREAVIKVLNLNLRDRSDANERFLREARLASRLDHPYAAHIYAFGVEPDGLRWIAMEYVRGTPLNKLLKAQGAMPLDRFLPLLERICEVVQSAHEQKVVHRDIKPANVMVISRAGRLLPKLLDFGIAKAVDPGAAKTSPPREPGASEPEYVDDQPEELATTKVGEPPIPITPAAGYVESDLTQGAAIGSPQYMAPEQWVDAASVDARSDIYALGILAFECLTGAVPFNGQSRAELARAHRHEPVPSLGPGMPASLHAVLVRALAKRQEDRFDDALELARAVRAVAGPGVEAEDLPHLDDRLLATLGNAPQPLAEAVSLLDSARNAHQARDAYLEVVHLIARLLGILALASRTRAGAGTADGTDLPIVLDLLQALRRRDLTGDEWTVLATELLRPFADKRDAHPLPELVTFFFDHDGQPGAGGALVRGVLAEHVRADLSSTDEELRSILAYQIPELAALLAALAFLGDYPLVVADRGHAERWMGARRARRRVVSTTLPLTDGEPTLLDATGRPVLSLHPLVQASPPAPGVPAELFVFDGAGRGGARLVATPHRFERHDPGVWDWLARTLVPDADVSADRSLGEIVPYRGLEAYGRDDAALFFGREKQVEAFVNRLRVQALLAIVGPSGAGKSSFVQAGVCAALPAREGWRVVTVRPGPAPLAALAGALLAGDVLPLPTGRVPRFASAAELRDALLAEPRLLGKLLRRGAALPLGPTLLVIDQFEEIFTLGASDDERRAYAEALTAAALAPEDPVRVVLTLRDDFLVRAGSLPALADRLAPGLHLLGVPAPPELQRTVVGPAKRAGYDFDDPELPARMVSEVAGQPGALALLSFTASRLWELRDRHFKQLTRKAYDALGGVGGALAGHAEATLAGMPAHEQRLVREIFRHLVTAQGTRAVLSRAELRQLLKAGERSDHVVEKLVTARLLVVSEAEGSEDHIEIVHEALLDAWPRLRGWRRDDAEGARLRDQLRAGARQWHERGRPGGLLWRAEALEELRVWRARSEASLTDVEDDFASASLREARRGKNVRLGLVAAAFVVLAVVAVVLAQQRGIARKASREAKQRLIDSYLEEGRQAYLEGDAARALVYLSAAYDEGETAPELRFLVARAGTAVREQQRRQVAEASPVFLVRYTADARSVIVGTSDSLSVWDMQSGARRFRLDASGQRYWRALLLPDNRLLGARADGKIFIYSLDDGRVLRVFDHGAAIADALVDQAATRVVSAGSDGVARMWDLGSGALLATLNAKDGPINALAVSLDGAVAVTGGANGAVRAWDLAAGTSTALRAADQVPVTRLAVSHDGARVLVVAQRSLELWRLDGSRLATRTHIAPIQHMELDPSSERALTASDDGNVRIWSAEDLTLQLVLADHAGGAQTARFSPSGAELVTGAGDGLVRTWDSHTGQALASYSGHAARVMSLDWSADGTSFASGGVDRMARTWRRRDAARLTIQATPAEIYSLALKPDGSELAVAGSDKVVRVFDASDGRLLRSFASEVTGVVGNVTYDRAGERLVLARVDGRFAICDAKTGAVTLDVAAHDGNVNYAELSPDGTLAVSAGSDDRTTAVWRVADRGLAWRHASAEGLVQTPFSPDGSRLALVAGGVEVLDARSGAVRFALADPAFNAIAWSHDGSLLAAGERDYNIKLWSGSDGHLVRTLSSHQADPIYVGFTPDDRFVFSVGQDALRVQSVREGHLLDTRVLAGATFNGALAFARPTAAASAGGRVYLLDLGLDEAGPAAVREVVACLPFRLTNGQIQASSPAAACPQ